MNIVFFQWSPQFYHQKCGFTLGRSAGNTNHYIGRTAPAHGSPNFYLAGSTILWWLWKSWYFQGLFKSGPISRPGVIFKVLWWAVWYLLFVKLMHRPDKSQTHGIFWPNNTSTCMPYNSNYKLMSNKKHRCVFWPVKIYDDSTFILHVLLSQQIWLKSPKTWSIQAYLVLKQLATGHIFSWQQRIFEIMKGHFNS